MWSLNVIFAFSCIIYKCSKFGICYGITSNHRQAGVNGVWMLILNVLLSIYFHWPHDNALIFTSIDTKIGNPTFYTWGLIYSLKHNIQAFLPMIVSNNFFDMSNYNTCPGWGDGSGSATLYQVHLELLNQTVCDNLLNPTPGMFSKFNPELMICAGDVENGGRDVCQVGH